MTSHQTPVPIGIDAAGTRNEFDSMGRSSNDTFPTAMHVAAILELDDRLHPSAVGRPQDAALTGITSIVVLVVAEIGQPADKWQEPLLRLLDTVLGTTMGLLAAGVLALVTVRSSRHLSAHREGHPS